MNKPTSSFTSYLGFSLIELLVVITIISILSAFAIPRYQDAQDNSRRLTAVTSLYQAVQYMERRFAQNNTYGTVPSTVWASLSPQKYTLSVDTATYTDDYFKLIATLKSGVTDAACGNFKLDSNNIRYNQIGNAEMKNDANVLKLCWGA